MWAEPLLSRHHLLYCTVCVCIVSRLPIVRYKRYKSQRFKPPPEVERVRCALKRFENFIWQCEHMQCVSMRINCRSVKRPLETQSTLFKTSPKHVYTKLTCVYELVACVQLYTRLYAHECVCLTVVNTCSKSQPRFSSQANWVAYQYRLSLQSTQCYMYLVYMCSCLTNHVNVCTWENALYTIVFCTNCLTMQVLK